MMQNESSRDEVMGKKRENKEKKVSLECEVCKKRLRSKYYLKLHMTVHTGEKNYMCGLCQKEYQQKWNLITHMARIHAQEKPFKCPDCNRTFGYSSHFKRHVKVHFLDKIQAPPEIKRVILNPFVCKLCKKTFESSYRLNLHVKGHGRTHERSFSCHSCGDQFATQSLLKRHSRQVHDPGPRFPCRTCPRKFTAISDLYSHLKADHKMSEEMIGEKAPETVGENLISCEVCNKIVGKSSIAKHRNIHYRNRVFCCRHCKKEFPESAQRTVHERKHTGEKPYSCDVCSAKCSQYSNLLTHRKRHHNLTSKTSNLWKRKKQNLSGV